MLLNWARRGGMMLIVQKAGIQKTLLLNIFKRCSLVEPTEARAPETMQNEQ